MRIATRRPGTRAWAALLGLALAGCGGSEEIQLKEVPPAEIAPVKDQAQTSKASDLKSGAPAKGSSGGINFNPSQTDRAR
ncbi:MAG: hypothetical protein K2X91_05900 [Thermoleophilia bacterium]|nr:hypothetical protein [Thermoleophilia bacterium]